MSDDETYYDELGVEPGASRDELQAAYQERISELEAAREGKGVTDAQLQRNREEVARVRAAWNVLSDPFQRSATTRRSTRRPRTVTRASRSWRRWRRCRRRTGRARGGAAHRVAPPDGAAPPKQAKPAAGNGKQPPPRRPVREPTIQLPPGMRFAEPRARGMAILFDIAVLLVIYWLTLLVVPGVVNSEYSDKVDQIKSLNSLHDSQGSIDDATIGPQEGEDRGGQAGGAEDLTSAQKDVDKTAKDLQKDGTQLRTTPTRSRAKPTSCRTTSRAPPMSPASW